MRDCSVDSAKKSSVKALPRIAANKKRISITSLSGSAAFFNILVGAPGLVRQVALQRYVPMLLKRILIPLSLQHRQRLDQLLASLARLNDGIHESTISRHVGVRQPLAKFFNLFLPNRFAIFGAIQLSFVDDIHRA